MAGSAGIAGVEDEQLEAAAGAVLEDTQLDGFAAGLVEVAHQLGQLVPFAAQVEWVALAGQAEDGQQAQGLLGGNGRLSLKSVDEAQAGRNQGTAVLVDTQADFDTVLADLQPQALAGDRIHPNLTGHMILARAFLQAIETIYRKRIVTFLI